MYKEATRQKLRFATSKGQLSVEQLWDLSVSDLDTLAVKLEDEYNNSRGRSFVEKRTTKDVGLKLQFDIVLDVLQTKIEESEAMVEKAKKKEFNDKVLKLIAEKKDGELAGKSIEELEAMLKEE